MRLDAQVVYFGSGIGQLVGNHSSQYRNRSLPSVSELLHRSSAVSYTHLDVYKRQKLYIFLCKSDSSTSFQLFCLQVLSIFPIFNETGPRTGHETEYLKLVNSPKVNRRSLTIRSSIIVTDISWYRFVYRYYLTSNRYQFNYIVKVM